MKSGPASLKPVMHAFLYSICPLPFLFAYFLSSAL